jgi:hypothetical protein
LCTPHLENKTGLPFAGKPAVLCANFALKQGKRGLPDSHPASSPYPAFSTGSIRLLQRLLAFFIPQRVIKNTAPGGWCGAVLFRHFPADKAKLTWPPVGGLGASCFPSSAGRGY